jgi:hypothetical protein
MRQAVFPNGDVVQLGPGMVFNITSTSLVTITTIGGSGTPYTYQATTFENAQAMIANLTTIKETDRELPSNVTGLTPQIGTVTPSQFNWTTDTVTIKGNRFSAATAGKLYINDIYGGQDDLGWYMICTFVDENTMTAVFGGMGDNNAGYTKNIIYYRDTNNLASNNLSATSDASNNVTVND